MCWATLYPDWAFIQHCRKNGPNWDEVKNKNLFLTSMEVFENLRRLSQTHDIPAHFKPTNTPGGNRETKQPLDSLWIRVVSPGAFIRVRVSLSINGCFIVSWFTCWFPFLSVQKRNGTSKNPSFQITQPAVGAS